MAPPASVPTEALLPPDALVIKVEGTVSLAGGSAVKELLGGPLTPRLSACCPAAGSIFYDESRGLWNRVLSVFFPRPGPSALTAFRTWWEGG